VRIPRPYIPISVRVVVAERQVHDLLTRGITMGWWDFYLYQTEEKGWQYAQRLKQLVGKLSEVLGDVLQLDHDPALILRKYKVDQRKPKAAWFTPNANDPDHLVYRVLGDHGQKTTGRKPGAAKTITTKGSDIWLKTKFARLEKPRKKPKAKIPQRAKSWPKRPFPKKSPASR
jgi:hypothetical protein